MELEFFAFFNTSSELISVRTEEKLSFQMKVMKNVKNAEENVANEKNANAPNE